MLSLCIALLYIYILESYLGSASALQHVVYNVFVEVGKNLKACIHNTSKDIDHFSWKRTLSLCSSKLKSDTASEDGIMGGVR